MFGATWLSQLVWGGQSTGSWEPEARGQGHCHTSYSVQDSPLAVVRPQKLGKPALSVTQMVEAPFPSFVISCSGHKVCSVATAFVL